MNCRRIQELLPLYVGRDLGEEQTQTITSHVQSCEVCLRSTNEYREAQQLLQEFEAPSFSDSFYAGIRKQVLTEIAGKVQSPIVPQVASLLRPSVRWSLATALLVAVCGVVYYLSIQQRNEPQVVNEAHTVDRTTGVKPRTLPQIKVTVPPPSSENKSFRSATLAKRNRDTGPGLGVARAANQLQDLQRGVNPEQRVTRSASDDTTGSMDVTAHPKAGNLVDSGISVAGDGVIPKKTLRMEIQTKDRNIRIIWFSSRPGNQDSLTDSDKGI